MKLLFKTLLGLLYLCINTTCAVKKIQQKLPSSLRKIELHHKDGFTVHGSKKVHKTACTHLVIENYHNRLYINKQLFPAGMMYIQKNNGTLCIKNKQYALLCVRLQGKTLSVTGLRPVVTRDSPPQPIIARKVTTKKRLSQVTLPKADTNKVRVLLVELKKNQQKSWQFATDHYFTLQSKENGVQKISKRVEIAYKNNTFYINKKPLKSRLIKLSSQDAFIEFEGKKYLGDFIIRQDEKNVYIINSIHLEEYTYAVLRSESWPGWPLEVNKALAITCRSYAMAMIGRARKSNKIYDMKDTNHHQRYNLYGIHDTPLVRQAVQETAGVFLSFNKLPALTMFDSCCGGLIPAHIADFDFVRAPYLARPYACTFCKNCSLYEWEVKYESAVLEQLLRSQLATLQKMTDVKIHKKDKAGIVQEVAIIQRGKPPVTLSGKKIYSLDKNIKSFSFNIQKKGGVWWLRGKGFGHHLGLCQWGARQMVKEGWNYRAILHYYYPGTSFSRITA